jgi:prepilin-type processing-associated H-X9-DG protein
MSVAILTYNAQEGTYPATTWDGADMRQTYYWTEKLIQAGVIKGKWSRNEGSYMIDPGQFKAYACPEWLQMTGTKYIWTSCGYAYNDIYLSPSLGPRDTNANPNFLGKIPKQTVIMLLDSDGLYIMYDYSFPPKPGTGDAKGKWKTIPKRHNGYLSSGWTDGHVEWKKYNEYTPRMINYNTKY